jgi:hypothetical protein
MAEVRHYLPACVASRGQGLKPQLEPSALAATALLKLNNVLGSARQHLLMPSCSEDSIKLTLPESAWDGLWTGATQTLSFL